MSFLCWSWHRDLVIFLHWSGENHAVQFLSRVLERNSNLDWAMSEVLVKGRTCEYKHPVLETVEVLPGTIRNNSEPDWEFHMGLIMFHDMFVY